MPLLLSSSLEKIRLHRTQGFIVLCGSLEIASRSLVAGAVRLCYALMYSLFLGFGLAIGAELFQTIVGRGVVGATDYACSQSHDPEGPWWQRTPSLWWAFLTVPCYSLFLSLRFGAVLKRKELVSPVISLVKPVLMCCDLAVIVALGRHFLHRMGDKPFYGD